MQQLSGVALPSLIGPRTDVPIALLPVRLETRYATDSGGPKLLVRVYVDDIHVDAHDPRLTDAEVEWGQHFWTEVWRSGSDRARQDAAWSQLAQHFGAPRAAFICSAVQPSNPAARPTKSTDGPLGVTIQFLKPTSRTSAWARGPRTRVLPDRWLAVGYVGEARVFAFLSNPIPDELAVGPSPQTAGFTAATLGNDPSAGWLVNFSAAEAVGMGLRIPFAATPLDRLLVLGVKAGLTPTDGATRLADLVSAQRFTQGISFARQGTASNNTDHAPAGDGLDLAFALNPLDKPAAFTAGDGSNRDIAARALGLDDVVLSGLAYGDAPEQRDAYHMNSVLWKATWGYFMDQIMDGPNAPSDDAIRRGREHFSSYVRARGPLPALRVGDQPYGVLPVVSLKALDTALTSAPVVFDTPVVHFLVTLGEVWRRALSAIPRLPRSADPATDLVRVLAMSPTSVGELWNAAQSPVVLPPSTAVPPPTFGSGPARTFLQSLGITWLPRHVRTLFAPYVQARPVGVGQVTPITPASDGLPAAEVWSDQTTVDRDYISWLGSARYDDIRTTWTAPSPAPLLYVLLRHAALLECVGAAYRILRRRTSRTVDAKREPDVVGPGRPNPWSLLAATDGGVSPTVGAYLDSIKAGLQAESARDVASAGAIWRRDVYEVATTPTVPADLAPELREFAAFTRSTEYLNSRPTAVLGRLLPEALDLSSHRFDAWATSFATKRLESLRARTPRGTYLGGYGWLEDLTPVQRTTVTTPQLDPGQALPPELAQPLYGSSGNKGYVHAPSLAHATTAAILRSGYVSRRASGDGAALAINLSSERVRKAMWLLDGVRQGQSLSTLLGYRFERGLHEAGLDRFILAFRSVAPASGAVPSSAVVDGLALLRRAQSIPWGTAGLPATGSVEYNACRELIRRLDDTVDSVSDLVMAESVHHVAMGNHVRAGATLEAIAQGEAPPPDIQVARTPRTGVALTHRLLAVFDRLPVAPAWPSTPRAEAEPILNAWVAQLLGPAAPAARCRVSFSNTGGNVVQPIDVSMTDLGVAPLDLVYLPDREPAAQWSAIEQRVAYAALQTLAPAVRARAGVQIAFARDASWPAGTLTFLQVLEAARVARRLIGNGRVLSAADLCQADVTLPDEAATDTSPSAERTLRLDVRASTAATNFGAAIDTLQTALDSGVLDTQRAGLIGLARYGVPGAEPVSPAGDSPRTADDLGTQARSVLTEARARLARCNALSTPPSTDLSATRDYHLARLHEIFGADFRALPRFTPPNAADLKRTFDLSATLQGGDVMQSVAWLQRSARVRDGAARLDASVLYAETLGGAALNLTVGQLPIVDKERWVGLPFDGPPVEAPDGPPRPAGGRLSLVVQSPSVPDPSRPLAGLVVDEWVEVVPSAQETTGLVFHYDQPNSRAPQAILLAVPPDGRPTWDYDMLEATLLETLELAKLRTVDLHALSEVGHFLPAVYLTTGSGGAAVATDPARLVGTS